MPYRRNSEMPAAVRSAYSDSCQTTFRKAFNAAYDQYHEEGRAFAVAHSAAKRCMGMKADFTTTTNSSNDAIWTFSSTTTTPTDYEADAQKAFGEIKAEPMETDKLDRWLKGEIPRRILAIPFGGPIPSPKSPRGVDVDAEWFSERTDLFDGHKALLSSRERLVDWHHDNDPTGTMKGAVLGRLVFDEQPEDDGYWADFWAKAGEKRLALVKQLEERGTKLYGSSQAAYKKADTDTGEILVWPVIREAISTSPQNTLAVMPPLKAVLTHPEIGELPVGALKALFVGLGNLSADLRTTSLGGEYEAKAGRVLSADSAAAIRRAVEELAGLLDQLKRYASNEAD